jgi:BirA family biotin operon repressor/biotin-[acetyl-CoA-carboxylase] ligase
VKSKVLELLINNNTISGTEISIKLGISRTAVWKHIKSLKEDGHIIESRYGTGYRLVKLNDRLTPEMIKLGLNCKKFARDIFYYDEIESTNEKAKRLGDKGLPEGTIIVAEKQTKGKGRLGRFWFSPNKGIYMSIIVRPSILPAAAPQLSLVAAAALQQTLIKEFAIKAKIKWPNDLLINDKKISGILTEMKGDMDRIHYIIIGVGINVNHNVSDFDQSIVEQATSLKIILDREIDKVDVLRKYLENLEYYYLDYLENGFQKTRKICVTNSHTINSIVTLYYGDKEFTGSAVDIAEDGSLVLDIEGKKMSFFGGEVTTKQ